MNLPVVEVVAPNLWCSICTPAQLYVILTIITIVGLAIKKQFMAIISKLIFALIYTFILNWLCDKGWTTLSWVLVLLPFIIILLIVIGFLFFAVKK